MQPLRIFIGYDPRQILSYTALCTSLLEQSSKPLAITPLVLRQLPIERTGLTPFTYSRFLVPWLCDFKGMALFMDADFIARGDIAELFEYCENIEQEYAVAVREDPEHKFERAALMMFNCEHPDNRVLMPEVIDGKTVAVHPREPGEGVTMFLPAVAPEGAYACNVPHLIDWTPEQAEIPATWGHLVGYNEKDPEAKLVHFTQGVPAWRETFRCEHAQEWQHWATASMWPWVAQQVAPAVEWAELMGPSVHAKKLGDGRVVPKLYDPEEESKWMETMKAEEAGKD